MTSIYLCYQDELNKNYEKWENVGNNVLREVLEDQENSNFKEIAESVGVYNKEEDNKLKSYWEETVDEYTHPIYNFVHLLETEPKNEDILKVVLNTNCTIIYDTEQEVYYIALTGCGMDLSQDIGLAFLWLGKWIPEDFINRISQQKGLSQGGKKFEQLQKAIIEQSKNYEDRFKQLGEDWKKI